TDVALHGIHVGEVRDVDGEAVRLQMVDPLLTAAAGRRLVDLDFLRLGVGDVRLHQQQSGENDGANGVSHSFTNATVNRSLVLRRSPAASGESFESRASERVTGAVVDHSAKLEPLDLLDDERGNAHARSSPNRR